MTIFYFKSKKQQKERKNSDNIIFLQQYGHPFALFAERFCRILSMLTKIFPHVTMIGNIDKKLIMLGKEFVIMHKYGKLTKLISVLLLLSIVGTATACGNRGGKSSTDETTKDTSDIGEGSTTHQTGDYTDATEEPTTPLETDENIPLTRLAAAEGMVLLKNKDNLLPLKQGSTVAIFGKGQIDLIKGGGGSGDVKTKHVVGVLEGLEKKSDEGKIKIYEKLAARYKANSSYNPQISEMREAAANSDTAIYIISRYSGEGSDRSANKGDYYLSDNEVSQIKNLISAGFKNIVVILNVGGVIDTTQLLSFPQIKSILLAWQPGQDGGDAIADILVGDITPSGKLSDTFARSYDDYPTSKNFHESPDYVNYTEDIFVGYRYFETFDPEYKKVNFEFGFGLSYTTFEFSDITFTEKDGEMIVSVKVTNTGEYKGKEVVQLYFSAPQGKLGKPGKELCAFAKTSTLAPGASQVVTLRFDIKDLSSYDDTGKVKKSAYVMEKGDYLFYLGNSIKNAGKAGVRYTYTVGETVIVEQLTEQMTAKLLRERLLADGTYENIFNDENIGIPIGTKLIKIEAEDYYAKHAHAQVVFNSNATISGLKILTSNEGNRYATFAVIAPETGKWRITLGIGNTNGKINNAVRFYVNDIIQSGSTLPLINTGGFWNIGEVGSATINLKKGLNFIRVEFACGDAFQGFFDYITLEKGEGTYVDGDDNVFSGTVKPSGVNKIEGENYIDASKDVGTESISAGADKGGTSVKNLHSTGYFVTYKLNVEEAGDYKIVMRVANGLGAATNAATATVNGVKQERFGYGIAYTGTSDNQWFNFINVDAGVISLSKGVNTLTFTVVERMGNLDYFTLEKISAEKSAFAATATVAPAAAATSVITFNDLLKDPTLIDAFIDQLTVEQMVYLLHGHGENIPHGTGSIGGLFEYGIPSAETADGPAGLHLYEYTTAWPVQTLMASTWNTALMKRVGAAIAEEAIKYNVDIWLAPGVNIHRNPLCGRNFEYYSEDPYLSGMMASALIIGVQEKGIGVMIKHFVCNEKETNRGYSDSRVSERALREIYLRPFEIAVKKANPWAIMSSYNKVNGVETAENPSLLTNILRGEWGYEGIVSSDWWNDSVQYKELLAGQSLKMKSGDEEGLLGAYKKSILTREDIEVHVKRVIELVMKSRAATRVTEEACIEIVADKPTVIRSIESTWKSSEIGMEECKDINGTYITTNTYGGQWMVFLIDVKKAGKYNVSIRIASNDGSDAIDFLVDGKKVGTFRNTVKTGDWQKWADSDGKLALYLTAGIHQLRLNFNDGGYNINTITLTPAK